MDKNKIEYWTKSGRNIVKVWWRTNKYINWKYSRYTGICSTELRDELMFLVFPWTHTLIEHKRLESNRVKFTKTQWEIPSEQSAMHLQQFVYLTWFSVRSIPTKYTNCTRIMLTASCSWIFILSFLSLKIRIMKNSLILLVSLCTTTSFKCVLYEYSRDILICFTVPEKLEYDDCDETAQDWETAPDIRHNGQNHGVIVVDVVLQHIDSYVQDTLE